MPSLNVSTFCVITGASRGIGRAASIQLAEKVGHQSMFCLVARGKEGLEETARQMKATTGEKVEVRCIQADLTNDNGIVQLNQSIFGDIGDKTRFEAALIFHNAGSFSGVVQKYARDLNDVRFLQRYMMMNLSGPIAMTSEFLKVFATKSGGGRIRTTVIQTTSIASATALKTLHLYCACKAGRDMFFKVLALEEPEVRVLTYEPGFVDTELINEGSNSPDKDLRSRKSSVEDTDSYLQPVQTAQGLVTVLEEDKFESGALVCYYDVIGMKVGLTQ